MSAPSTTTMGVIADRATTSGPNRWSSQPLWILSGRLGVIVAVFLGFGAHTPVKPKMFVLILAASVIAMVAFGPVGRIGKLVISPPVMAFIAWWMCSVLWTYNGYGWWRETQRMIPLIGACVAFCSILPLRELTRALVSACYVAIGYTVLQLVMHPGAATVNADGVPGWRGGFLHKNAMAPFMLFAILTLITLARPSIGRGVAVVTAIALVALSQSSTSMAAGLVLFIVWWILRRVSVLDHRKRTVVVLGSLLGALVSAVLLVQFFPVLLGARGKDVTLSRRTEIWNGVLAAIREKPWQGYGAGGVWTNPGVDPARSILRDLGFTVFHSHNGFLEMILLLGVIGLALLCWLGASTVRRAMAALSDSAPFAVFVVVYVLMMVTVSVTEVATLDIWLAWLCGFHCALVASRGSVDA